MDYTAIIFTIPNDDLSAWLRSQENPSKTIRDGLFLLRATQEETPSYGVSPLIELLSAVRRVEAELAYIKALVAPDTAIATVTADAIDTADADATDTATAARTQASKSALLNLSRLSE